MVADWGVVHDKTARGSLSRIEIYIYIFMHGSRLGGGSREEGYGASYSNPVLENSSGSQ